MSDPVTGGIINLNYGYRFFWTQGAGDREINGHVQRRHGGVVKGSSGWYRTNSPEEAAKIAEEFVVQDIVKQARQG